MHQKTALITGVTGQDGSYLSELLLDNDYYVVGMKRRSSTNNTWRLEQCLRNPDFKLIEGDVTDFSSISGIIREYEPDIVANTAAQSHVGTSFQQPSYMFNVCTNGVLNLLESIRQFSPNSRIIQFSTSEMFGNNYSTNKDGEKYQDENTALMPTSPYAVAKVAAHHLIRLYRDAYGIFACSMIGFNHESCRRGEDFVTRKITKWIGEFKAWKLCWNTMMFSENDIVGIQPEVGKFTTKLQNLLTKFPKLRLGNIDAYRDWGHSKDFMRGVLMILQADKPSDYVLATGDTHSVREFLLEAFNLIGVADWESYVVIDPAFYRASDVEFLKGDASKAKEQLGWVPEITFKALVKEMVEYDIQKAQGVQKAAGVY